MDVASRANPAATGKVTRSMLRKRAVELAGHGPRTAGCVEIGLEPAQHEWMAAPGMELIGEVVVSADEHASKSQV